MRKFMQLTTILVVLAISGFAHADRINVPGDYAQIHDAVQAAVLGDTVMVAAGTYTDCTHPTEGPESTPACVIMKSGVTLMGAGPDLTIIDVQQLGRGIFVEYVDNCSIENLQVTDAFAEIYGAGILLRHVPDTVKIKNVKIVENYDGGIICINDAHPIIENTTMIDNFAKQGGGLAIEENCSPVVTNCLVDGNTAPTGAGIFVRSGCAPTIVGCVVSNNEIDAEYGNGGGICIQSSTPDIHHCDFIGNTTLGSGGGVAFIDGGNGTMHDCVISGNFAAATYSNGGGLHSSQSEPVLESLLIMENTCTGTYADGGGIDIQFTPAPTLTNCTISNNTTGPTGIAGGIFTQFGANPVFEACIISFAASGEAVQYAFGDPLAVFSCCDIFGNFGGDTLNGVDNGGNFSADPDFCGTPEYEYNISSDSPCAPDNSGGCGRIGSAGVGCSTAVEQTPAPRLVLGNRPNPFNPITSIFFVLNETGPATVRIYDVSGRTVMSFYRSELPAGVQHEITWNGRDHAGLECPSGVYLYELTTNGLTTTNRMSLIR